MRPLTHLLPTLALAAVLHGCGERHEVVVETGPGVQTTLEPEDAHGEHHRQLEPAATAEPSNRDPHGPRNVENYISALLDEGRVEGLEAVAVLEALALAPDSVVADVGCGPGTLSLALGRAVPRGIVYAVDVEPRQLDVLRARVTEAGLRNVVPVLASVDSPFVPPGVDVFLVVDTYHHIDERVAYFTGLRERLAPGGRLVLIEYLPGDIPVGPPASHKLPVETRHRELREAGFELGATHPDVHEWHDFEVWRAP
jgi:SAM-dependent methyltransferase